jgi:ribosomal protein S18 acetylase RimI-like enzyme
LDGKEDSCVSDVLNDLSAPALVAAIKGNLFEWYHYLGSSPSAELCESPEQTWLLTGIPMGFLNVVLCTQVEPDHAEGIIEETLAHFQSKNVSRLSWWVEPGTRPADLGRYLTAHGLTYVESPTGMAADLSALNEHLTAPSGLEIERVGDMETLRQWAYASIIGSGLPETSVDTWFDIFAGLGFELPLRNYLGILDGEPVATSQLLIAAGVAGIYVVVTLPEARRQGIGTAMTLAPLREARALGYRIGILHASSMALGMYRRIGFREYCKMSRYVWADETSQ